MKLLGKYLIVRVAMPSDKARVKLLVEGWFREHGRKVIAGRLVKCVRPTLVEGKRMDICKRLNQIQISGIPSPVVRFQKMEKRWGSCSRKGAIVLNTELAKASVPCIDYVLFHELCHLKYPHHGREFYSLLARFVPDWRKWKERLEMVAL